ncbi:hypothetical protein BJX68DRAFT_267983 [Aspergillus pseudodeflectus]|uniref:MYND-type zinc finger protein samB n=1 Tax=Aspergillus pseudodeflectus TaxID=176178 RepID=A0ABR4K5S6_9EURO
MDCDMKNHILYPTYMTLPTEIDLVLSPGHWQARGWFLAVEVLSVERIEGYKALLRVFDQEKIEFDLIIEFQGTEAWTFPLDKVRETDALFIRDAVMSQLPNGELGVTVVGTKQIKVIPYALLYLKNTSKHLVKARTQKNGHHVCFYCQKTGTEEERVPPCEGCLLFYFCSNACRAKAMNYKWHYLQCQMLQDDDVGAVFAGNWEDVREFSSTFLVKNDP